MSIINEALKKTQLNIKKPKRTKKAQAEQAAKSGQDITNVYEKMYKTREEQRNASDDVTNKKGKTGSPKIQSSSKMGQWLKTAFALILLCAVLFGCYSFLSNYGPLQEFLQSKSKRKSSRIQIPRNTVKKRKYKPGELILNGTSMIDGKRVALINDEIYEIGDVADGKTITSIATNKVELRDNQKIITIKVR